jgi:hypothetical protein
VPAFNASEPDYFNSAGSRLTGKLCRSGIRGTGGYAANY